ncbi:hypothetical protein ABPG77_004185 [Micractinium sp. CCAP 211/92]
MTGTVAVTATASGGGIEADRVPEPLAEQESSTHGFRDYYRVLSGNRYFLLLWVAEMIDNIGSWLSYVATLELASELSGGSGLALSAVVLIRFLPSLLLAPVCGVVADRTNRCRVLVWAAAADAATMAVLALVPAFAARSAQVALLYLLLGLQFSAASFYEPARKALVPVLVPASQLHLAATVDSWAWSITGAVGASVGGVVASKLGKSACFLVDTGSYLVAAWCALQLPVALGAPDAAYRQAASRQVKKKSSERGIELGGLAVEGWDESEAAAEEGSAYGAHAMTHAERRHLAKQQQQLAPLAREPAAGSTAADRAGPHEQSRLPLPAGAAPAPALVGAVGQAAGHGRTSPGPPASSGSTAALWAAAKGAMAEGARATAEGWRYVTSPTNRDVAALVMMKCAAALVWGAVDILNVRFSEMPEMQALGDASATLGFIFAAVGFGCFVGPVALNAVVPPRPPALRWGVAASYGLFAVGLLVMLLAPTIWLVLASTIIRSMGSAALWVYSTLLMQKRVPNEFLGRMSAVESAGFTIAEALSSVFGGAAFDVLHLTLEQLVLILTAAAIVEAAGWCAYAFLANRSERREGLGGGYQPVLQKDTDEHEPH